MIQYEQARQISLERILIKLGFQSAYTSRVGEELWYHSPFRDEKTPSFKVDIRRNVWFDFGENLGGSPIDLIVHVFKTDFYGALKILSDFDDILFQTSLKDTPSVLTDEKVPKEDVFLLENVQPFSNQNTSLHHYIVTERCIDVKTISPFLKTVFFKHLPTGKSFVAAGIENTEGGMKFAIHFLKGLYLKVIKVFLGFRQHTTMNELLVLKDLWIFYPTALFSVGVRKLSYIKFDRIFKKSH